ncbi:MAG: hypothetical protein QM731_21275 [Chitinophagaceae bacterium]
MKKQLSCVAKTTTANILKSMFIAGALIAGAANAKAQTITVSSQETSSPVKSAIIKHLGNDGDNMYFQVLLNNESGEKFYLTVKDADGVILFQETYNDKKFDKKFLLTKGETDKVTFVLKSAKNNTTQSFEINSSTKLVEEIVVKRM